MKLRGSELGRRTKFGIGLGTAEEPLDCFELAGERSGLLLSRKPDPVLPALRCEGGTHMRINRKERWPATLLAGSLLGLGAMSHEAAADSILFPYLSTQSGVYSFVTIVNDGRGQMSAVARYLFSYGYKVPPVVQRGECIHFDALVTTTPADMMTFEVGAKIGDGQPLFEEAGDTAGFGPGKLTSTSAPLTAANAIAFLIVDFPAASGVGAPDDADDSNTARLFGWAEVIDPAANMTLAYSTHDFLNDANAAADFSNLSGSVAALSWHTAAAVTTSWHVLHLGTKDALAADGGIRGAVESGRGGMPGGVAAFDRDENPFSGTRSKPVRCFAIISRGDIMAATSVTATDNGGWTYLGPSAAGVPVVPDPTDVADLYPPAGNTLVHKIQTTIPAATGLGTRSAINREPTGGQVYTYVP